MNTKIKALNAQIELIESNKRVEILPIQQKLKLEWNKIFDKNTALQAGLKAIDDSTEYTLDEYDELFSLVRIDLSSLKEANKDALVGYCTENGFTLDIENSCLLNFQGAFIGINEEGDIYLQDGKTEWIIDHKDYETIEERNALIEAHMEKTGHYPSVISVGRYGDVRLVNTQKRSVTA